MKKLFFLSSLVVIVALLFFKLVALDGGVILGEPDEAVHVEIVESLINFGRPIYRGVGFYFELPAYFWVASVFSRFIFHNPLSSLRFVSLISIGLTGLIVFYYLRVKEGRRSSFLGLAIFFLIPLTVFYGRVGIIEPFLLMSLTGAVVFFDLALARDKIHYSWVAGIFLGLGFLAKYSILPVALAIFLFSLVKFAGDNRRFVKEGYLYFDQKFLVPLILASLIFFPVFFFFYFQDPLHVKWQTKQIFGLTGEVTQQLNLYRLIDFPRWFSWPVIVLAIVGWIQSLKEFRKYGFLLLCFFLLISLDLTRLPFYPRYLVVLLPFLAIFSTRGLTWLKNGKIQLAGLVLLFLFNLPFLVKAHQSSYQTIIERAVAEVRQRHFTPAWVFSNYWPNYFADPLKVARYSWATLSPADMDSFAKGEPRDMLTILAREGGAVFLEEKFADLYITQSENRLEAVKQLESRYRPSFSLTDQNPNFPFTAEPGNRLDVYLIAPLKL